MTATAPLAPCPTCGRASINWLDKPGATKTHQRSDSEDRAIQFKQWHRDVLDRKCYATDIDLLEWRRDDGRVRFVALLELTRFDGAHRLPTSYLHAVEQRFFERDGQGETAIEIASRLGCKAYIVLFHADLTEFYVYDLSLEKRWVRATASTLKRWLEGL